eukprot:scaffold31455_cov112-Isochrysis_galbana.AAC.4
MCLCLCVRIRVRLHRARLRIASQSLKPQGHKAWLRSSSVIYYRLTDAASSFECVSCGAPPFPFACPFAKWKTARPVGQSYQDV